MTHVQFARKVPVINKMLDFSGTGKCNFPSKTEATFCITSLYARRQLPMASDVQAYIRWYLNYKSNFLND